MTSLGAIYNKLQRNERTNERACLVAREGEALQYLYEPCVGERLLLLPLSVGKLLASKAKPQKVVVAVRYFITFHMS
jgi:hypothetical protein